jgi:hypothetical protein
MPEKPARVRGSRKRQMATEMPEEAAQEETQKPAEEEITTHDEEMPSEVEEEGEEVAATAIPTNLSSKDRKKKAPGHKAIIRYIMESPALKKRCLKKAGEPGSIRAPTISEGFASAVGKVLASSKTADQCHLPKSYVRNNIKIAIGEHLRIPGDKKHGRTGRQLTYSREFVRSLSMDAQAFIAKFCRDSYRITTEFAGRIKLMPDEIEAVRNINPIYSDICS